MGVKKDSRPRINMAFDEENYRYVKLMSGVACLDMTKFINMVIEQHRAQNAGSYEAAQALMEGVNGNGND